MNDTAANGGKARETPRVGLIVLNLNGLEDTLECLASIHRVKYPEISVIVVDNGSREDPGFILREKFPRTQCIRSEQNLGIPGGNNLGIQAALGAACRYVVLLNNDTVVAPDFLDHLVAMCEADPTVGIAGPLIMDYGEPNRIQVAGFEFSDRTAFKLRIREGQIVIRGENELEQGQFPKPEQVSAISECAMFVRREVFSTVGLQNPHLRVYFQDFEFCLRAARAGFRSFLVPGSRIWHKGGRTVSALMGANNRIQQYWYIRDLHVFMREKVGLRKFLLQWLLVTARTTAGCLLDQGRRQYLWRLLGGSFSGLARAIMPGGRRVEHVAG
jgi:GT2 family glycosyltransferase